MRRARRTLSILFVLLIPLASIGIVVARAFWPLPPVDLIVSRETTYFTEPLNADGTVDYVEAHNRLARTGVTPENNAAIPILRALGPAALPEETRERILAELGILLPPDGPYFTMLDDHLTANASKYEHLIPSLDESAGESARDRQRREAIDRVVEEVVGKRTPLEKFAGKQLTTTKRQPWSSEQYPILAQWLETNNASLDAIAAAATRSRFFIPMVSPTDPPEFQLGLKEFPDAMYDVSGALASRAMLRLGEGDLTGAGRDALAMCRLGRVLSGSTHGPACSPLMLCFSGTTAIIAITQTGRLTPDQATEMLREHLSLPPAGSALKADASVMRLMSLDFVMKLIGDPRQIVTTGVNVTIPANASIDVNDILRRINRVYDRIDHALSESDIVARRRKCSEACATNARILADLGERVQWEGPVARVTLLLSSATAKRRYVGDAIVWMLLGLVMPPVEFADSDAQLDMNGELARLALALGAYHAEHQRYPPTLADLSPACLPSIPKDFFSGDDLCYQSDGDSYKLYSVGRNLIDDGGDEQDDLMIETGGQPTSSEAGDSP